MTKNKIGSQGHPCPECKGTGICKTCEGGLGFWEGDYYIECWGCGGSDADFPGKCAKCKGDGVVTGEGAGDDEADGERSFSAPTTSRPG